MKFSNILEEIEKVDGDIYERLSPRRKAMKDFFNIGSKVALTAMPFAIGSMFNKAYGQSVPAGVIAVLQYALTLEHFEAKFYVDGFNAANLVPAGADKTAIQIIRDSELKHVTFLQQVITSTGNTPVAAKTMYDFTAGGTFPTVFTSYPTFLAVAQVLEDTGVRAYKGQAGNLQENSTVLTVALQIHSVESRHAAHIRRMRMQKGWITQANSDSSLIASSYTGEDVEVQEGVTITGINTLVNKDAATEAFDEPLNEEQVTAIVKDFIVS